MPSTTPTNIIALDLETTSKDPTQARIVQAYIAKVDTSQDPWHCDSQVNDLINPGVPIPPDATDVHGITDDDVAKLPLFDTIASKIQRTLDHATHVIAYNGGYDLQILDRELRNTGHPGVPPDIHLIDPYTIFKHQVPHTLESAYRVYTGSPMDDAHDAAADTQATVEVLQAQLANLDWPQSLEDTQATPDGHHYVDWAGKLVDHGDGTPRFAFGKHQGQPVTDHVDYAHWMLNRDFPEQTKTILKRILNTPDDDADAGGTNETFTAQARSTGTTGLEWNPRGH